MQRVRRKQGRPVGQVFGVRIQRMPKKESADSLNDPLPHETDMGYVKDLLITVYGGGEDAVNAVAPLLKAAAIGEWVPVNERMPDRNGGILVCVVADGGKPFVDSAHFFNGLWWTGESPAAKYPFRVTHWMPLPEVPECATGSE